MEINKVISLGEFLKKGRESRKLSLRAVEDATGVSNAYLSQLEGGRIQRPSPVDLHKLCKLYGISYALAMEYAGYPLPEGVAVTTREQRFLGRLGHTTPDEENELVEYMEFLRTKKKKGK